MESTLDVANVVKTATVKDVPINNPANNFTFPKRSQNVPPKPQKTFPCNVPITLKWKVSQTFMNVPR